MSLSSVDIYCNCGSGEGNREQGVLQKGDGFISYTMGTKRSSHIGKYAKTYSGGHAGNNNFIITMLLYGMCRI